MPDDKGNGATGHELGFGSSRFVDFLPATMWRSYDISRSRSDISVGAGDLIEQSFSLKVRHMGRDRRSFFKPVLLPARSTQGSLVGVPVSSRSQCVQRARRFNRPDASGRYSTVARRVWSSSLKRSHTSPSTFTSRYQLAKAWGLGYANTHIRTDFSGTSAVALDRKPCNRTGYSHDFRALSGPE